MRAHFYSLPRNERPGVLAPRDGQFYIYRRLGSATERQSATACTAFLFFLPFVRLCNVSLRFTFCTSSFTLESNLYDRSGYIDEVIEIDYTAGGRFSAFGNALQGSQSVRMG